MTALRDSRGNPLTGANHVAAAACMEGLGRLNLFTGDPVAGAEAATDAAPGFVMGHALRAWLFLLSSEAPAWIPARHPGSGKFTQRKRVIRRRDHHRAADAADHSPWHRLGARGAALVPGDDGA
jgi:hypothetical protein